LTPGKKTRATEPAELPRLRRRLHFGARQVAGLAVLILIPILALFKVFGEGQASAAGRTGDIAIFVDYPPRVRYGSAETVVTFVTNAGGARLDTVTVRFDSGYVARVSEPHFVPRATRAFEVELANVAPGETRRVELAFHTEDYGRHSGLISAWHGGDTARTMISTIVLP
jgi:hypothetical protein